MGYALEANNKELDDFHFGAFSWTWFLVDEGAGLILGVVKIDNMIGKNIYNSERGSPLYNDGFKVTSTEAKMLAVCADTILGKYSIQSDKIREDFLQKLREFIIWATKSKGFRVH